MARILATLALFISAAVYAQTKFVLDSIEVDSSPKIASIVRAETRLVPGNSYTENDVRQAVYRARRLPFVVRANYELKPGKTAGSRILVITIADERRLNYDLTVEGVKPSSGGGTATTGADIDYRMFTGGNGVLDATIGSTSFSNASEFNSHALGLGYSAYGLFGTSAYAQVSATRDFGRGNDDRTTTGPFLLAGIPLTGTQTLQTTYDRETRRSASHFPGIAEPIVTHTSRSDVAAAWLYQTNDDPLFARRGTSIAIGPSWGNLTGSSFTIHGYPTNPVATVTQFKTRKLAWTGDGEKFWPLGESFAAFANAHVASTHVTYAIANTPGYTVLEHRLLLGGAWNRDHGELARYRFELGAGFGGTRTHRGALTVSDSGLEAMGGWAYRGRYGLVHFSLIYATD